MSSAPKPKTTGTDESASPLAFDVERLGRSLREIAVDVIDAGGTPLLTRWFRSGEDADLLVWFDDEKNVIKHQVSVFGQVVEWNVFEGVKTGVIIEEETSGVDQAETSEQIQFDPQPQSAAIRQAVHFLEHAAVLAVDDRRVMCENLLQRRVVAAQAEELVRRYQTLQKVDKEVRPSFWRRLRRWFSGSGS